MNLGWGDDKVFLETDLRQFLQSISPFVSTKSMIPKKPQEWEGFKSLFNWSHYSCGIRKPALVFDAMHLDEVSLEGEYHAFAVPFRRSEKSLAGPRQ
jgi:hypothetical protein